jgi:hypothetical protein
MWLIPTSSARLQLQEDRDFDIFEQFSKSLKIFIHSDTEKNLAGEPQLTVSVKRPVNRMVNRG